MTEPSSNPLLDRVERAPFRRSRRADHEVRRWVVTITLTLIAALILLGGSLVTAIYLSARSNQQRQVDAIVVMGAAQFNGRPSAVLKARLDTAFQVWEDGAAPLMIVTGGKMPGDRFTESEASRDYLVDKGVPGNAILLESEGRNTEVSLDGVAQIANEYGIRSVLIVSDGFHLFRSKLIADQNGLTPFGIPVEDGPINSWSVTEFDYVARESAAVLVYMLF